MKNCLKLVLLFLFFSFPHSIFSQKDLSASLPFEVNKIYPYVSKTKAAMNEAETLMDLNDHYPASWVKEYISVEVWANSRNAVGKNEFLTQEQKDIMNGSDIGSDILVKVRYLPENELKNNEVKELSFTFVLQPEKDAHFIGGQAPLLSYLKEKAIDKIPEGVFTGYDLAALRFTISEEGAITDALVIESSKDEQVDALLLEAIRDMPCWVPAEYTNGEKIRQDFMLTVGNMENCIVHTFNIRS
jgi:TonB family protein